VILILNLIVIINDSDKIEYIRMIIINLKIIIIIITMVNGMIMNNH